jgi:hypothetical protein
MPLSIRPNHFEFAAAPASTYDALREIWWWLNGTHPSESNSIRYECLEVWDGTTRQAPIGGSLANLSAGNLWKPSASPSASLPEGAWAVFRNPGGAVSAQFAVFVRMEASAQAGNSLISLDDWTVGGGTGASPTLPATILGQPPIGDSGDGRFPSSSTFIWSALVDEGMIYIKQFPVSGASSSSRWAYIGEADPATIEADDPRPFITPRNTSQTISGSYGMVRLSPVDQATLCQLRIRSYYDSTQRTADPYDDLGPQYVCNIAVDSEQPAGHRFTQGYLRNVGAVDQTTLSDRATLGYDGADFRFEVFSRASTDPHMVLRYPPGTALAGGHTVITEASIPTQLVMPAPQLPAVLPSWACTDTLRHLLPRAFQWNLVYDRPFVQLVRGLCSALDAAKANADEIWRDLMPATAEGKGLVSWEEQFNLTGASSLTLQERRDRLAAAWAAQGGQSPSYIEETLQAAGFPVFVHEWWVLTGEGYPEARDPRDYLLPEYGGTDVDGFLLRNLIRTSVKGTEIGAGEPFAQAGEPDALAGFFTGWVVSPIEATYVGPESRHPYYLYIGGETFPGTVDIPADRRSEFEALCQKICPAQQWLVLRVRYV